MKIKSILLIILISFSLIGCEKSETLDKEVVVIDNTIDSTSDEETQNDKDIDTTDVTPNNIPEDNNTPEVDNTPIDLNTNANINYTLNEGDDFDNSFSFVISDFKENTILEDEYSVYFDSSWMKMVEESGLELIRFIDVNFDGYDDVVTQISGAETNQYYRVYLYNFDNNTFTRNEDFEALCNPIFNDEANFILSTNYGQMGLPNYEIFQVTEDIPVLLGHIDSLINDSGEIEYLETMVATYDENKNIIYLDTENTNSITTVTELNEIWTTFEITLE